MSDAPETPTAMRERTNTGNSGGGSMKERAVQFGTSANLVGVLTEPGPDRAAAKDRPAVVLLNAGILHRVGPSRMNVRIARRLAQAGFPCFRFDFSGIGDSAPRPDDLPFEESSVREIREAMDHLEGAAGVERFVLGGLCSGADAAYHGALADPRVAGLLSIDGHVYRTWRFYVHRYLPRLFRLESWLNLVTGKTYVGPWIRDLVNRASENGSQDEDERRQDGIFQRPRPPKEDVERGLRELVAREVEMLHVFSGGLEDRYNYASQFRDAFRSVDFEGRVQVEYFGDSNHTFTDLGHLEALVRTVGGWARRTWTRSADSRTRRGERAA